MKNKYISPQRVFFVLFFAALTLAANLFIIPPSLTDTVHAKISDLVRSADVQKKPVCVSKGADGSYEISNFRWGFDVSKSPELVKPIWKNVKLNANDVSDVFFCLRPFPPYWLASHAFLFFEFREGAQIVSGSGEKSRGMILSIEPQYPAGKTYGTPMRGGPYFIVYQLSSIDDYMQICERTGTRVIRSYRLKLTGAAKKKLFEKTLESSFNCDFPKYDLFMNNCINNIFVLFNSILPDELRYRKNFFGAKFWNPNVSTPQLCVKAIKSFGLLDDNEPPARFFNAGTPVSGQIPLTGDALKKAAAVHKDMLARVNAVLARLIKGVDDGKIASEELKDIFYNEMAGYVPYLYIPPTDPGAGHNAEFKIGEEFLEGIASDDAKGYLRLVFKRYADGLYKRLAVEGPDASKFINANIADMKKAVEKAVR